MWISDRDVLLLGVWRSSQSGLKWNSESVPDSFTLLLRLQYVKSNTGGLQTLVHCTNSTHSGYIELGVAGTM